MNKITVLQLMDMLEKDSGIRNYQSRWRKLRELLEIQNRLTPRAADLAVCTCSTMPTTNTLQVDPECPVHSPNR